jgi:hypothetical protein
MSGHGVGAHNDLHNDQGARRDEHPGRSRDPIIKVHDIAWLEFEKPDLTRAEAFSAFFSRQAKNPEYLRPGDIIEAAVATDDGGIDLGVQRTAVKYA